MKALFWNIGSELNERKLKLLSTAIRTENPDIFCIAEGTNSKQDCQKIIVAFDALNYSCYYSPLFSEREGSDLDYDSFGLKIFVRDTKILKEKFSFQYQRMNGRIIILKTFLNFRPTSFIFLHSKSKAGSHETTIDQYPYIFKLKEMIEVGRITDNKENKEIMGDKERVIIMGDFNIEPWEKVLNHKSYLITSFFRKHNELKQRKNNSDSVYFNPSVELIFQSNTANLVGTYYNNTSGWALFDYILYDTKDGEVYYDILTEFDENCKLLNCDKTIKKSFLNDELDHLPIVAEIKIEQIN